MSSAWGGSWGASWGNSWGLLSGITPAERPRAGHKWPWRVYRKCSEEDEECADEIVEALEGADAEKVETAIVNAAEAVSNEQLTQVIDYEEMFQSVVLHVRGAVRDEIREILNDRKIRRKRLREIFQAKVEKRIREEAERERKRIEAQEELDTVTWIAFL
tara:strand:- start:672 stop:1151 length:480 start_codon:yes stop_codon:yes gene_type:complete